MFNFRNSAATRMSDKLDAAPAIVTHHRPQVPAADQILENRIIELRTMRDAHLSEAENLRATIADANARLEQHNALYVTLDKALEQLCNPAGAGVSDSEFEAELLNGINIEAAATAELEKPHKREHYTGPRRSKPLHI